MRSIKTAALVLLGAVAMTANAKPAIPRDPKIEKQVEATLAKMTLDEKVGQMLELNLDVFGTADWSKAIPTWTLDEARLDTVIKNGNPVRSSMPRPLTPALLSNGSTGFQPCRNCR